MQNALSCAHFVAGRYADALSFADMSMRGRPNFVLPNCIAAASAALAERMDEAHKAMARVRQIAPDLSISNVKEVVVFKRPEDTGCWAEGLRKAGLPE
jgi:hypothetical protein